MILAVLFLLISPINLLSMAGENFLNKKAAQDYLCYYTEPFLYDGMEWAALPNLSSEQRRYLSSRSNECDGGVHNGSQNANMITQFNFTTEPKTVYLEHCTGSCNGWRFLLLGGTKKSILYPCYSLCGEPLWKKALILTRRAAVRVYAQFPSSNTFLAACVGGLFVLFLQGKI